MQERSTLNERALSDAEVAQILSLLLNKVAGVVNLAEGLVGRLPVLGPVLNPIFGLINDDLSLILSSVGNLLVGVVGLVRDLVSRLFQLFLPTRWRAVSGCLGHKLTLLIFGTWLTAIWRPWYSHRSSYPQQPPRWTFGRWQRRSSRRHPLI
jgi:hypothetical protein